MATINGTDGNDTITGTNGNDIIDGLGGDDIIAGGAGADVINGDDGADRLYAGAISPAWTFPGPNQVPFVAPVLDRGIEVDTLNGGAGIDTIYAGYGDKVDGETESADLLISLAGASSGVTVDFRNLDNGGTLTIAGGLIQNIRSVLWVEGSNFDDTITGGNDGTGLPGFGAPIFGLGGNDHIIGGQATGNIYGGDGNDIIELTQSYFGGPTGNVLYGDAGDDIITVTGDGLQFPYVSAFGGDGNDTITAAGGLSGGAGNDTINVTNITFGGTVAQGDDGDDTIADSNSSDTLIGGNGADTIYGNDGADIIASAGALSANSGWDYTDRGTEHDVLSGGAGDDVIYAGYGDDVDGGAGFNSIYLSLLGASSGITLDVATLESGNPYAIGGGTIQSVQQVFQLVGTNFDDVLTLSRAVPVYGMDGNDVINGTSGWDEIHGGAGADIINAGDGDDQIVIDAVSDIVAGEQINGGVGNDTLLFMPTFGQPAAVSLVGVTVSGIETLKTFGGALGVTTAQIAGVASLIGNFNLEDSGAISLTGKNAPFGVSIALNAAGNQIDLSGFSVTGFMVIAGSDSNDSVMGTGGSDNIYANGGDDFINGGLGDDNMVGGTGNDTYVVDSTSDGVGESANEGIDTVQTSITINQILYANVENLTLTGTANISGFGNAIDNAIIGNSGANLLVGDVGNDTLSGAGGNDRLSGGAGNDSFADTAAGLSGDTITDFSRGDRIVISDATLAGFTFSLTGSQLAFTGGSLTLSNLNYASIAASAAPEGGVQITFSGPPIILSAGASVSPAAGASASALSAQTMEIAPTGQALDQSYLLRDRTPGWHAGNSPITDLLALA